MNKIGVKEGAIDAKQQAEIRKTKNLKVSTEPKHKATKNVAAPGEMIYGMMNRPSTPIEGVISNTYGQYAEQEAEEIYKNSTHKPKQKSKATAVRTTKAQEKKMEFQKSKKVEDKNEKVENFKIKRFTKVEPRVQTKFNKAKKAAEPEEAKE